VIRAEGAKHRMGSLIDPTTEQNISSYGTYQDDDDGAQCKSLSAPKPRLLTVSYSCLIIVQTWLVFGLTMGYTSPVLSDLEGNRNSSLKAPLDKIGYQDLFSVSELLASYHSYIAYRPSVSYTIAA